jgi:hypothetical protein
VCFADVPTELENTEGVASCPLRLRWSQEQAVAAMKLGVRSDHGAGG